MAPTEIDRALGIAEPGTAEPTRSEREPSSEERADAPSEIDRALGLTRERASPAVAEQTAVVAPQPAATAEDARAQRTAGPPATGPTFEDDDLDEEVSAETRELFERARAAEREDPQRGVRAWRKAARRAPRCRTPLRALTRLFARLGHWSSARHELQREIDLTASPAQRRVLLHKLVAICGAHLPDETALIGALRDLLALDGDDPSILEQLATAYDRANRQGEMIATLERKAEASVAHTDQLACWKRIARLYLERFRSRADATRAYEQVLALDPGDVEAIGQLERLYEARRDWVQLAVVSLQQADLLADRAARAKRYAEIARELVERDVRPAEAIELLRRVLRAVPEDGGVVDQLESLCRGCERWETLAAEVYPRRLALAAEPQERRELLLKLASIQQRKLNRPERARDTLYAALRLAPDDTGVLRALRRLMAADAEGAPTRAPRLGSPVSLSDRERIYRQGGLWRPLADLLREVVHGDEPGLDPIDALERLIALYEQRLLGDEPSLRAQLERDCKRARALLVDALPTAPNDSDGVAGSDGAASSSADLRRQVDLVARIAQVAVELQMSAEAMEMLREASRSAPDDPRILEMLAELLRRAGRSSELVALLRRRAAREPNERKRVRQLLSAAAVAAGQDSDRDQAVELYREVVELEPDNPDALDALERTYRSGRSWEALRDLLERRSTAAARRRLAELYAGPLKDPARAIQTLRELLEEQPASEEILQRLGELHARGDRLDAYVALLEDRLEAGGSAQQRRVLLAHLVPACRQLRRPERVAELLPQQIELSDQPAERSALQLELGRIYAEDLEQPARGARIFDELLAAHPDHRGALEALASLHERLESWPEAADALERWSATLDDPKASAAAHYRLGHALEQLGQSERAVEHYRRSIAADPAQAACALRLVALYRQRRAWARAVGVALRAAKHVAAPQPKAQLLFAAAAINHEQLGREREAAELLSHTLRIAPDHPRALETLAGIHLDAKRYAEAEPLLETLLGQCSTQPETEQRKHDLHCKLGATKAALGKIESALEHYRAAQALDPGHVPTLVALTELKRRARQ